MNTIQLECFVSVAEHLNFSKASRVLKITQPAVSHQIQSLEEELNVKLFTRTSKSVALTQEGLLFLPDARLILRTAFSAKERLGTRERFTAFELGCHNHMELDLLPEALKKLTEEFPLLRPSITLVPFPSIFQMLENGQIQAALGIKEGRRESPLAFKELSLAPMAAVCSPEHPLAQHKSLTFRELARNQAEISFISCSPRHISDAVFTPQSQLIASFPPERRYFTQSIESALTLARARIGFTLYPDIPKCRESGLRYIPVTDLPRLRFGVYYPRSSSDYPVLKRFLALIAEELKEKG